MNLQIDQDHLTTALAFFSFLGFSCFSGLASSSLLALLSSSFSFLRRVMVTLAVVATLVANSKAPPAKVTLHPLHPQMPAAVLLIWDLPQAGQTYLARCCNQNFLTIFLMEEPQRVPYFPVTPTFLVLLAIPQLKQYNIYINFYCASLHDVVVLLVVVVLHPVLGSARVGLPVLLELPRFDQLLLALGVGALLPLPGVGLAVHDHSLGLGHHSVIARADLRGSHLGDGHGDGLSLGGHDHDFSSHVDSVVVAQDAGDHQLGTVADGVDGGILDHDAGQFEEQDLEGEDNTSEIGLILVVLEPPLGVQQVVHGHQVIIFGHAATPGSAQFLHVSSHSQKQTNVDAESSHVGSSLAGNTEDTKALFGVILEQLRFIDGPDTEFSLDSGDLRRFLEETASEGIEDVFELDLTVDGAVQPDDADVLFTRSLLGFGQSGGSLETDDEAAGDLGIEGARVASLLNIQDLLDPGDDLVGAGIGGLVEVDDTVLEVLLEGPLERGVSGGDGSVVSGEDIHEMVVFEQQWPLLRPDARALLGRPDHVLLLHHLFVHLSLLLHQSFLFFIRAHC